MFQLESHGMEQPLISYFVEKVLIIYGLDFSQDFPHHCALYIEKAVILEISNK